jgi:hypothetical protein
MGFTKDTEANGLPTHSGEGAISSSAVIRPPQDGHGSVDKAAPEARPRRKPGGGHERPSDDDLPETYGRDEVEILSKDPHWYFIYWEVTDADSRKRSGSSDLRKRTESWCCESL